MKRTTLLLLTVLALALPARAQTPFTNLASKEMVRRTSNAIPVLQIVGGTITTNQDANGKTNIITVSGGGSADTSGLSNSIAFSVSDIGGTLNLYDDFSGTNGPVTTNLFISEQIPVGRRLHIRGPGGADTGTNVARLGNRLVFTGTNINDNESVYIAHQIAGIEGQYAGASNQIRYAVIRFDLDDGATLGQTPLLMISSSGVVEAGTLVHFGYNPTFGTADVTFHTNGFNEVSNYFSFSWTGLPAFLPSTNLVFAWSIDGTNLWANFGGDIRYTNSPLLDDFNWGDKTIVQSYEFTTNATRRILFRSVTASTQPVRMTMMPQNFLASTNGVGRGLTINGEATNESLRVIGPISFNQPGGSSTMSIGGTNGMLTFGVNKGGLTNVESITGQAAQHAFDAGGMMFESGASVLASDPEFILFANTSSNLILRALAGQTAPQLQLGNVSLLVGSATVTNLTVLNGGTLTGVFSGAGLSTITNFTAGSFSNGVTVGGTAGIYSGTAFRQVVFNTSGVAISSGSGGTYINTYQPGSGGIEINGQSAVTRMTGGSGVAIVSNLTVSGIGTLTNGVVSMRTNAFTTTELTADGQWGDWWSNRTAFYRSARNNGNVTNYLITTTP